MRFLIQDNISEVVKSLKDGANEIASDKAVVLYQALTILEVAIKQNIRVRSGLRVRSGTLLNSVQKHIIQNSGNTVSGSVGPENVPYAQIHEEGGVIPAHFIQPRHGLALKWMGGNGKFWFSKGHMIPDITIKARPYMMPALIEKEQYIREQFGLFLQRSMEKNL